MSQYSDESIKLSGITTIASTVLDFTGSTTASTTVTINNLTGYLNNGRLYGFVVEPPKLLQSGTTGTTTVDVTGWVLTAYDSGGTVYWAPNMSADTNTYVTGGTLTGTDLILNYNTGGSASPIDLGSLTFSGGSGNCITDLYVTNIHGCYPITIWDPIQSVGSVASGVTSMAIGVNNIASNTSSIAFGGNVISSGPSSFAEGAYTISSNDASHAEGYYTVASGDYSHSEGSYTTAVGESSHAGGSASTANGLTSFVHSYNSIVSGNRSVVLGGQNITGSTDDTVYVPYLNIGNIETGTSVSFLAITSGGTVISGSDLYGEICDYCSSTVSGDLVRGSGTTETDTLNGSDSTVDSTSPVSCTQWCYYQGGLYVGTTTDYELASKYEANGYTIRCCDSNSSDGGTNYGTSISASTTSLGNSIPVVITGLTRPYIVRNARKISFLNTYKADVLNSNQSSISDSTLGRIESSTLSSIESSFNSKIYNSYLSSIIASENGFISGSGNGTIIGSQYSILSGTTGSTIIGGNSITGTSNDTVYVPKLNIKTLGSSSPINNLGIDSNGNVVTGTTGGGNIYTTDGTLNGNRIINTDGFGLALSGGSSATLFGLIGTGDKRIQWSQTGVLNWDLINDAVTNDLQIDRYSSGGGYLDTPIFFEFLTGNIGIKQQSPSEALDVSGKTKTINFQMASGATPGYVLTSDAFGNATWQASTGGGGVSIDPYYTEPSNSTFTWDVSGTSTNYQTTLTANTTLNLTNVRNGDYGTIILTQDVVGGRTLTFGTINGAAGTHRVVNGGGGSVVLTSTVNAIDILTFTYNGSGMYWTVGNDYT